MFTKISFRLMLAILLFTAIIACNTKSQGPPEDWNGRAILSYDEERDAHYACTLVGNDYEYKATFEDFMGTGIFQDDAKIEWSNIDDDSWRLVTAVGPDLHDFELRKVITAKGNEGVEISSWSVNGYKIVAHQKTGNLHKLLDSKEYHLYLKGKEIGS
jgi:hypothetical protein